jgi:hypothetical protein
MEPKARGPKLYYPKQMDETFIIREGILTVLTARDLFMTCITGSGSGQLVLSSGVRCTHQKTTIFQTNYRYKLRECLI